KNLVARFDDFEWEVPVAPAEHHDAEQAATHEALYSAQGPHGAICLRWVNRAGAPRILRVTETRERQGQLMQMGGWAPEHESAAVAWLIEQLKAYAAGRTTKPDMEIAKKGWLASHSASGV
ncbi:unnamed protein product, partial [Prorocentrum cordatum]